MARNIEVEIRSFISQSQYQKLLKRLKKEGRFCNKDYQITYYFSGPKDLRIQKNNYLAKIWFKKGKIHDKFREEIEIKFNRSDFEKLKDLFLNLGYKVEVTWYRQRNVFKWKRVEAMLDYTKGYGYIIELEKLSRWKDREKTYHLLRQRLKKLGVKETPKKEFTKKFQYYKKNWRKLV